MIAVKARVHGGDCRTDEMQMPACRQVFPTTSRRTSYGGRS
jgi:hypothetical protein